MSYTRMTVGDPRFRVQPPRGLPPCVEPYRTGANILTDPGFELHLANTGGGPLGDEIPGDRWLSTGGSISTQYESWSDGALAPHSAAWAGRNNYIAYAPSSWPRAGWTVSAANPRSGNYHARSTLIYGQGLNSQGNPSNLRPVTVYGCEATAFGRYGYSARCQEGNAVTFSFWAAVTNIPTDSAPFLDNFFIYFIGQDQVAVSGRIDWAGYPSVPITTSYQQFQISAFAPADSYFVTVDLQFGRNIDTDGNVGLAFDVDDAVLAVL